MEELEDCGGKYIVICTVCGVIEEDFHGKRECETLDAEITDSTPDIVQWEVPNGDTAS